MAVFAVKFAHFLRLCPPSVSSDLLTPFATSPLRLTRCTHTTPGHSSRWTLGGGRSRTGRSPMFVPEGGTQGGGRGGNMMITPFVFTVAFCTGTFIGTSIWRYENIRHLAVDALKRRKEFYAGKLPKEGEWRQKAHGWWSNLSEGEKVFFPLLFLNVCVYLAWRVPAWQPAMMRYFASTPVTKYLSLPMLLSTFSHHSFLHLAVNMYVLHSFAPVAGQLLGKEQFLCLYLSSGVISAFGSLMFKVLTAVPNASLGASGAIMGILAYVCSEVPQTKLSIVFLPMIVFSAGSAIKAVMLFDSIGLMLRWKIFDHAAHLGGATTGIVWQYFGNSHLHPWSANIMSRWHHIREKNPDHKS